VVRNSHDVCNDFSRRYGSLSLAFHLT
jgi:hypothetical protein